MKTTCMPSDDYDDTEDHQASRGEVLKLTLHQNMTWIDSFWWITATSTIGMDLFHVEWSIIYGILVLNLTTSMFL